MTGTTGNHDTGTTTTPTGGLNDCWVSPSDQAGQIDNILDRLKKVEDLVALLTGANLSVGQLSELSEQVGWVTVDYLGQPGWIQTEYGTLIPPPGFSILGSGFTLSDGNVYTAVVMDENGVLQYGWTDTGEAVGESATAADYIVLQPSSTSLDFGYVTLTTLWSRGTAFSTDSSGLGTKVKSSSPGLYHVSVNMNALVSATSSTSFMWVEVGNGSGSYITVEDNFAHDATHINQSFRASFLVKADQSGADGYFSLQVKLFVTSNLYNIDKCHVSIHKLGAF